MLDFDGKNDYVAIPQDPSLDITDSLTVEVWIYPRSYPNNTEWLHYICCKRSNQGWHTWLWYAYNKTDFVLDIGGSPFTVSSDSIIPLNTWSHLVYTWNGTYVKIYLNGDLDITPVAKSGTLSTGGNSLRIGHEFAKTIGTRHFDGYIEELRIYDRAINSTEISYSYNSGNGKHNPLNETGLVAWYHFNEGSGSTNYDETNNDNDGSLTGASWVTGKIKAYLPPIHISELQINYTIKLLDSDLNLVTNGSANSEGQANLTLPEKYLESPFSGTYRFYDDNISFLYQKWYEDIKGGDQYEIISEETTLGLAIIGLVLALFALILALSKFG